MSKVLDIIIITGLSGSGKSTALAAFEDFGHYCVDNMPVLLLPKFLELPIQTGTEITGLTFVMDLREKGFLSNYKKVFDDLKEKGQHFEILFLEANEDVLVRRFSQTRRQHPLTQNKGLMEGIRDEKEKLADLRKIAHTIIDTSNYNVHQLKSRILNIAAKRRKFSSLHINVLSFGFKYGVPAEADLVIDVRFLRNPFFVPELKPLTGENSLVADYVIETDEARVFLEKYLNLLDYLLPLYDKEGKTYLTVAVGCTGGQHRSVAISRKVFDHIDKTGRNVELTHRDIHM